MKILFVEAGLSGHRKIYHKTLIESIGVANCVLITPKPEPDVDCEQVVEDNINLRPRTLNDYNIWIGFIKHIADKYNVNVIHFLDGDLLYRFCGYKLSKLKDYKTVVTFHHVGEDFIHKLSVQKITKKVDWAVVHTERLRSRFRNIRLVDYPYFPMQKTVPTKNESREFYHISPEKRVLLSLGGTRYEKGVDILLNALRNIKSSNVLLLIAGNEEYFKKSDLEKIDTGIVEVVYYMKPLMDSEWCMALSASDIVVLPYRRSFAGASGPLAEAVWFEKPLIGKNDGSIGDMIKDNELGWTFETENSDELGNVIDEAVGTHFRIGVKYRSFKDKLSVARFEISYKQLYE